MTDVGVKNELPVNSPKVTPEGSKAKDANNPELPSHTPTEYSALAPPAVGQEYCTDQAEWDSTLSCYDMTMMEEKLQPIEEQLQYLLNKADEFQAHLIYRRDRLQNEGFARVVPTFLRTCQPYFTYLESTARSSLPQRSLLPLYIRARLLQFSQQLCGRLEQLVLMYASFNFLSLEEADPLSISHFFIGQCQIDGVTLSIFRYCRPAPFLSTASTGRHKRMRWNVGRQRESHPDTEGGEEQQAERGREGGTLTEYYFLCYEDAAEAPGEADGEGACEREAGGAPGGMWSIGQWVQTHPDPEAEDIYDWALCWAPQGQYRRMLCLGGEEPSACTATDCLLGVLLSQEGHATATMAT